MKINKLLRHIQFAHLTNAGNFHTVALYDDADAKYSSCAIMGWQRHWGFYLIGLSLLGGCASIPKNTESASPQTHNSTPVTPQGGGGYYLTDGPGAHPPADIDAIPDAVPRIEPLHQACNKPYQVLGKTYTPSTSLQPYDETGLASWYGRRFNGHSTSSGETYNMYAMTAAHPTLPIPSYARVISKKTGQSVIVRINDRGPFHSKRIIDLSYTAAHKLGLVQGGSGMVEVIAITPDEISKGRDINDSSHGIFLQLGSFLSHEKAEKLLADASTRLDKGTAALVILNHEQHYRVALGPYTDEDSAKQAEEEIKQRMQLSPVRLILP